MSEEEGEGVSNQEPAASELATIGSEEDLRFQVELEFVQSLANPEYLQFLGQRGYLKDPAFKNYVKYLNYWKQPEYARFVTFPICLNVLDWLADGKLSDWINDPNFVQFLSNKIKLQWIYNSGTGCRVSQNGS